MYKKYNWIHKEKKGSREPTTMFIKLKMAIKLECPNSELQGIIKHGTMCS